MQGLTPRELSAIYPITEVTVHRGGNLTIKRSSKIQSQPPEKKQGQKITKLSTKSLRRLIHTMQCSSVTFKSFITLTYGQYYPRDGSVVKSDLKYILKTISKYSPDYLWFLEFQKRGAPHFHVLTTVDCIAPHMRFELMAKWVQRQIKSPYFYGHIEADCGAKAVARLCKFNIHSDVWELVRDEEGAKKYVAMYASKPHQKHVPKDYQNVGRFWGCSKSVSNIDGVRVQLKECELRTSLQKLGAKQSDWDILPKYLWGIATKNAANGSRP